MQSDAEQLEFKSSPRVEKREPPESPVFGNILDRDLPIRPRVAFTQHKPQSSASRSDNIDPLMLTSLRFRPPLPANEQKDQWTSSDPFHIPAPVYSSPPINSDPIENMSKLS